MWYLLLNKNKHVVGMTSNSCQILHISNVTL